MYFSDKYRATMKAAYTSIIITKNDGKFKPGVFKEFKDFLRNYPLCL